MNNYVIGEMRGGAGHGDNHGNQIIINYCGSSPTSRCSCSVIMLKRLRLRHKEVNGSQSTIDSAGSVNEAAESLNREYHLISLSGFLHFLPP